MTTAAHEKWVRVFWLETLGSDDLSEVTLAEIQAGQRLPDITADGINRSPTNNRASLAMIDSDQIAQEPGTRTNDLTIRFRKQTDPDDDIAWELFDHGTSGFLVIASNRFNANPQTGDRVEIYETKSFAPQMIASAQDTIQQYEIGFAHQRWEEKAEVTAS